MALVNYSKIKDTLKALTGIDDLNEQEEALLKYAVNRRIRMAYEESRFWPGFVYEETRYASYDNVVPYDQTNKNTIDTFIDIQSADPRTFGSTARRYDWVTRNDGAKVLNRADVAYQESEWTANASSLASSVTKNLTSTNSTNAQAVSFWMKMGAVSDYGSGNQNLDLIVLNANGSESALTDNGNGLGQIRMTVASSSSTITARNGWYKSDEGTMHVYIDGILAGTDFGTSGAGVDITDYADGEWHHYIWTFRPDDTEFQFVRKIHYEFGSDATQTHDAEFDISDIRVYPDKIDASKASTLYENPKAVPYDPIWASKAPTYWVSYKANLPGTRTYGDGSGEVVNVPLEWFEYAVHGAYADWLRGEGQTDKAIVEEQIANQHLERQLERIQHTQGSPYLWSRFSTHRSRQWR